MFAYNSTGVKMDNSFAVAPEGIYTLIIVNASDEKDGSPRHTKNGDPYVNVECEINDAGEWQGTKVYHNVTFMPKDKKGAGMAVQFLKTIGQPHEGQFDVDPSNWKGSLFRAKLIVGKDNKGRSRNEISYVVTEEKSFSDEVPF